MIKPLRVLMVEDSEDDVLLLIRALKKGGYEPEYERVETTEAMRAALLEKTWDVILYDYTLPRFSGLEAVFLLRETELDIPIIIVSGAIGEETAVEAMKAGAHDYVMKGNLSRLVPAIEREIKDAVIRRERKQAERRQELVNRILSALNSPNEITNLTQNILLILKEYMGIEALCVRLREGNDFPYYETNGFPPHFLEAERYLCARDEKNEIIRDSQGKPCLECMCGTIICGRTDPSLPFFTEGGSFWTNSTTKFLASTTEADRQARMRNRCQSEGYESVALIPLKSGEEIIGLLQLNDRRLDRFTKEMIRFLEGIGASVGIAIHRRRTSDALRESEEKYRFLASSADAMYLVDRECRYQFMNEMHLSRLGVSLGEIKGKSYADRHSEEDSREFSENVERVFETGKSFQSERKSQRDDKYFLQTYSPVKDSKGSITAVTVTSKDITERKRAEEHYKTLAESSLAAVFIVQDGKFRFINTSAIAYAGYSAKELIGRNADMIVHPEDREMVKSKGRAMMLGNDTSPYEFRMVAKDGQIKWIMQIVSPIQFGGKPAILGNAIDITMRKKIEEEHAENFERLRKAMGATVHAMAVAVETRDPYTAGHQRRVADLARAIATEMNLSSDQIDGIRTASVIHDIGKISVPVEILSKPTKLNDIEFSLIKTHSQSGYDILKDIEFPWPIARIVLEHHERLDGSGYPNGLTGENLLMESKILAIADVVEAVASHRPYRAGLGIDAALDEIAKNKGVLYDPEVVDVCLRLFHEKGYNLE